MWPRKQTPPRPLKNRKKPRAAQSKKKQRQFPNEKRFEVQGEFRSEIAGGQVRAEKRGEEHEERGCGQGCGRPQGNEHEGEDDCGEDEMAPAAKVKVKAVKTKTDKIVAVKAEPAVKSAAKAKKLVAEIKFSRRRRPENPRSMLEKRARRGSGLMSRCWIRLAT